MPSFWRSRLLHADFYQWYWERIPQDLYEAATIDGANKVQQFGKITMPLLRNYQNKYNLLECSHHNLLPLVKDVLAGGYGSITIVPVVYLYDTVFGGKEMRTGMPERMLVGVVLALIIVVVYFVMNRPA